jgi:hypothetical protein
VAIPHTTLDDVEGKKCDKTKKDFFSIFREKGKKN